MVLRRTVLLSGAALVAAGLAGMRREALAEDERFEIALSDEEWRARLTEMQYYVLREHGTERAFTSPLDKLYEAGTYRCAGCASALYSSETKFDSRTGWPSFWQALPDAVGTSVDNSLFMTRTECHCARCGGHLGHIFEDGPPPTGKRHCINGAALDFVPA